MTPIFVGSGAPKGKNLEIPGRYDDTGAYSYRHSTGSSLIAFDHTDSIGKNVLIIGVGNTAMDCCRSFAAPRREQTSRSWRASHVNFFKASDWELEDAEEENWSTSSSTIRRRNSSSRTASLSA